MKPPKCPYCKKPAQHVKGKTLYPNHKNLYHRRYYRCVPCEAHVGCHKTGKPLGTLANKQTRQARIQAHKAFDPIWKTTTISRPKAYAWLAKHLKIPYDRCHIGNFDFPTCVKVIKICNTKELPYHFTLDY